MLSYKILIFYIGLSLGFTNNFEGFTLFDLVEGMSNISAFETIRPYLSEELEHGARINLEDNWLRYQPAFGIIFDEIKSKTRKAAIEFAFERAEEIMLVIAKERGDRPAFLFMYSIEYPNLDIELTPAPFDFMGNLISPMSPGSNATSLLEMLPRIKADSFAKFTLTLYTQCLAERDWSFRLFRLWSLIELIADRNVAKNDMALKNLDGSLITLSSCKNLTTNRKEGKVYHYLRNAGISPIRQGIKDERALVLEGSLGGPSANAPVDFTLWQAVAASYKIRNSVAHEGRFDSREVTEKAEDQLAKYFYEGLFDFLELSALRAVNCEIYSIWKEN